MAKILTTRFSKWNKILNFISIEFSEEFILKYGFGGFGVLVAKNKKKYKVIKCNLYIISDTY